MRCEVCKESTPITTGICIHCGSLAHSPVQKIKDTINSHLVNILLGSFGMIIVGIILLGAFET